MKAGRTNSAHLSLLLPQWSDLESNYSPCGRRRAGSRPTRVPLL